MTHVVVSAARVCSCYIGRYTSTLAIVRATIHSRLRPIECLGSIHSMPSFFTQPYSKQHCSASPSERELQTGKAASRPSLDERRGRALSANWVNTISRIPCYNFVTQRSYPPFQSIWVPAAYLSPLYISSFLQPSHSHFIVKRKKAGKRFGLPLYFRIPANVYVHIYTYAQRSRTGRRVDRTIWALCGLLRSSSSMGL